MADPKDKTSEPKDKTVGEKVIDIIHSVFHGSDSEDGISPMIKTLSKDSIIGGTNRKSKIDDAITKAGG